MLNFFFLILIVISRRTSKIQANPAGQFSAMLPTIVDEGSTLDHSKYK
jgi:hypothetical protein